ncbi:MAG: Uma2 family endonuclease [Myxacorys chilensis ATA2-1-KO14]|jgi:Uma2 family endonuclease|nr:Uma2 family endonuclease [Myxacorys chilensis ATA2-1-KO14]
MTQTLQTQVTFDEFIAWYPENSEYRYELHNGKIIEMPKPRGKHSRIGGFIAAEANFEIRRLHLPYFIPTECLVKSLDDQSGYEPDVIILDDRTISNEPRWEKGSIITLGQSVGLIVEVVSTNWQDDYLTKLKDYELLGIAEYWIVDYLGLGGRRYIGNPKQPTLSIYQLIDGEYEVRQFRGSDRVESPLFPELTITADAMFAAGQ